MPANASIHPIFHVSQLKKKLGQNQVLQTHDPSYVEELVDEPEEILDHREIKRKNQAVSQVLIKWKQSPSADATW